MQGLSKMNKANNVKAAKQAACAFVRSFATKANANKANDSREGERIV